ncbi:hypothetical protein PLICRDRAFT_384148 [Plicaturopsis crispa FD-325 SS-3]|nr:hypothetical protein PLICRDRAFT_384148 [Plicaturopsis crispa FD-325 SS-3]
MAHSDTDTESESDIGTQQQYHAEHSDSQNSTALSLVDGLGVAIQTLGKIDPRAARRDQSLHGAIHNASNHLVQFLDGFVHLDQETHQDPQGLKAFAKLPNWQSVPDVIASDRMSPAAKRLALQLVFATCVVLPQLEAFDPWFEDYLQPRALLVILKEYLLQAFANTQRQTETSLDLSRQTLQNQGRANFAMVVSLFAAAETSGGAHHSQSAELAFRPHTLAILLRVIRSVINPEADNDSSAVLRGSFEALDTAQTILVRWGDTISWAWKTWDDQRIAHVETITDLTTTWLYHLDTFVHASLDELADIWTLNLASRLTKDPIHASSAVLAVLHRTATVLETAAEHRTLPSATLNVVLKCCWAVVQLSELKNAAAPSSSMCACLFGIFVHLGETASEVNIKFLIIKAFSLSAPELLRSGVDAAAVDKSKIRALETAIVRATRILHADAEQQDQCAVKLMLHFLTVVWTACTTTHVEARVLSTFLTAVFDNLVDAHPDSPLRSTLLDGLVNALVALEALPLTPATRRDLKICKDKSLWRLVCSTSPSNTIVAAAFSQYISMKDERIFFDPLTRAEVWDFLQDTLLLILTHQILGEEEVLGLVNSTAICRGLTLLLRHANAGAAAFIRASPLTALLAANLQRLLDDTGSDSPQYSVVLRERLEQSGSGKALLNEISRPNKPSSAAETARAETCLLFCCVHSDFVLVSVPKI